MTSEVTDVLEAVQSFIAKGYDREYRVKDGNLVDLELGSILDDYRAVNTALRPLRFEDYVIPVLDAPEPLDPLEATFDWIRRFD